MAIKLDATGVVIDKKITMNDSILIKVRCGQEKDEFKPNDIINMKATELTNPNGGSVIFANSIDKIASDGDTLKNNVH